MNAAAYRKYPNPPADEAHSASMPLLKVEQLKTYFQARSPYRWGGAKRQNIVRAVDGVSFELERGETLALVGESGCGKTTAARSVLRLEEPTGGSVHFEMNGAMTSVLEMTPRELRDWRRRAQMVFQDPYGSLNPRMKIADIVTEGLRIHGLCSRRNALERAEALLDMVGLDASHASRYPHEFSGGQRQRIGVARALALEPELAVADEPVSALDMSAQAQAVNLMQDLQERLSLSYLFISHDLSVVRHIADRVAVMYLGRIVEIGRKAELYADPLHPYTKALLSAIPLPNPTAPRRGVMLQGDAPSALNPPSGCPFHPRCPIAQPSCSERPQRLAAVGEDRAVACDVVLGKG